MSMFYSLAYRLGFAPWERAGTHPPAVRQATELFEREERGRRTPFGRALDLGCGRGHWAVTLARRGWSVTGVDLVPGAIESARARARAADVDVLFLQGDVTRLRDTGLGAGFQLVWDFGTAHGLTQTQRAAVGREISAVAAEDATILMLAWGPGRRGPLPRGMSRSDLANAFEGWKIVGEEPFDVTGLPGPLRNVDPRVYRLRRV